MRGPWGMPEIVAETWEASGPPSLATFKELWAKRFCRCRYIITPTIWGLYQFLKKLRATFGSGSLKVWAATQRVQSYRNSSRRTVTSQKPPGPLVQEAGHLSFGVPTPQSFLRGIWVAVEELSLSYHNMQIYEIIWFWKYGNLV